MKHCRFLPLGLFIINVAFASEAPPEMRAMETALRWRATLALAVAEGETNAAEALERLRTQHGASGLPMPGTGADFALAAIDIGHRLLLRHPSEAEIFFRAAEDALDQEVKRTDNAQAKTKALYLQKLALIRSHYLNQPGQAEEDIRAATRLQPEDKYLLHLQKTMAMRAARLDRSQLGQEEEI